MQAMERERAMAEKMMEDFKSQWAPQLDQVTEAQVTPPATHPPAPHEPKLPSTVTVSISMLLFFRR